MIPKVASHILHHTSRAAATAQNYTFRNVLGLQNPTPSSSGLGGWSGAGSSSWGGYGAGPGGAKYSSGSRFYTGYQGAGRGITQANSTAQDAAHSHSDDNDELRAYRPSVTTRQTRSRPRSNSLSLSGSGRSQRAETFGVLRSVQLHQARAKHVLARVTSSHDLQIANPSTDLGSEDEPSRPLLVRRNSTSATGASDIESVKAPRPASPDITSHSLPDTLSTDPAAPQTSFAPTSHDEEGIADWITFRRLEAAMSTGDPAVVMAEVENFRKSHPNPTVREYNMVLDTLYESRTPGKAITVILETYNEMLTRQIVPNVRTYDIMIRALCDRDREVHLVVSRLERNQADRLRHIATRGRSFYTEKDGEVRRIKQLQGENSLTSALLMFEALQTFVPDGKGLTLSVYNRLLRSCALAGNVDAAIRVFSHLEASENVRPNVSSFYHLLSAYVKVGDLAGSEEVFKEFRVACTSGRLEEDSQFSSEVDQEVRDQSLSDVRDSFPHHHYSSSPTRGLQMLVWVKMVQAYFLAKEPVKAIDVLSQMLDSKASTSFTVADVPLPSSAVYTAFISGFIENNDVKSALIWFERMLVNSAITSHPLEPLTVTPQPDEQAWHIMIQALAEKKKIPDLNRLFQKLLEAQRAQGLTVRGADRLTVLDANVSYLRERMHITKEELDGILTFLLDDVMVFGGQQRNEWDLDIYAARGSLLSLIGALNSRGSIEEAICVVESYVKKALTQIHGQSAMDVDEDAADLPPSDEFVGLTRFVRTATVILFDRPQSQITFGQLLRFGIVQNTVRFKPLPSFCVALLDAYYKARGAAVHETQNISAAEWRVLVMAACQLTEIEDLKDVIPESQEFAFQGLAEFLQDAKAAGMKVGQLRRLYKRVVDTLVNKYGKEATDGILARLSPDGQHRLNTFVAVSQNTIDIAGKLPLETVESDLNIDSYIGKAMDEHYPSSKTMSPQAALQLFRSGVEQGRYAPPEPIARLITTFGRLRDVQTVHSLYNDAQTVLNSIEDNKNWQAAAWYMVENQMIIALGHAGEYDKAHVHRQRILDQGGRPSSDAYGALIQHVSETTDDSANALALWNEAQSIGVVPNIYLYNTLISKLSKARKADLALEFFQQMKQTGVRPTSVTYGAVIAACCRVGDAQSAETLFEEMVSQRRYAPRVPPYNTMIQFYTHIARNRQRALYFFDAMLTAGVKPTAHTYKLLIDCYGTIGPVDISSMGDVFNRLLQDKNVQVQGVHWAALINAYGCVQKDLEKAVEVFDGIASHPSTAKSGLQLPDAVTFESLINVLVTLRRTDLIPVYLERLSVSGIHMTAYIANLLIKGNAAMGDIEKAREIFESLHDAPMGVAAPHNHAPHDPSQQKTISPISPVYREPSTWEAMVRAELGTNNRENAVALLRRLEARGYPQAVFLRISGIMLDDNEPTPWSPSGSNPSDSPTSG